MLKTILTLLVLTTTAAHASSPHWIPTPDPTPARITLRLHPHPTPSCTPSAIQSMVEAVSFPSSSSYGNHFSLAQMRARCGLSPSVVSSILSAVPDAYLERTSTLGDALYVSVSARVVEEEWGGVLRTYTRVGRKSGSSPSLVRSQVEVGVPAVWSPYVVWISGLDDFPPPRQMLEGNDGKNPFPGIDVTPEVIRNLYKITYPSTYASRSLNVSQAIAEFEDAYAFPADLAIFLAQNNLPPAPVPTVVGKLPKPSKGYYAEYSLDQEFIVGIGQGVNTWAFYLDAFDLIEWAELVLKTAAANSSFVPTVQSISWGSGEQEIPQTQAQETSTTFGKMAAMGYTLICASGDQGTGKTGVFDCKSFSPTFPASITYCTSVGATFLEPTQTPPEQAVSFSGGGFSTYFDRPSWQDTAVSSYLSSGVTLPDSKYYNANGAGIPDVSALGTNFQIVVQNYTGPISGTSAATPTFAAAISLINTHRVAAGNPPLGFISPLLYSASASSAWNDITVGDNKVFGCDRGFKATHGWDPISGLGSFHFPSLLSALD